MGSYVNEVEVYDDKGLHFSGGAINFANTTQLNAGAVGSLANGRIGSFWISQANSAAYFSKTSGNTTTLSVTGPL